MAEEFAKLSWTAEDIQDAAINRGLDITDAEAIRWLNRNAKHIQERLTELGWEVIGHLMDFDSPAPDREPNATKE